MCGWENSFRLFVAKFIGFLMGKIILRKYIKKKMENIIIYIISDINRKYIGFDDDYYSISILFEEDVIIKKRRYFKETIWVMRWM